MKKTLILTDNDKALDLSVELIKLYGDIDIRQSPNGKLHNIPELNIRNSVSEILSNYSLVISIHCKQFFPPSLVNNVRCLNVHPGYNPHNRGWFPQVFSIINGLPSGVTIHEMDEQLDHGPIIVQKKCVLNSWDTSTTAYNRIMSLERELMLEHFISIRNNSYDVTLPNNDGNINYFKDYKQLSVIGLDHVGTFREFLDRLRALTHDSYNNAYYINEFGKKVFIKITFELADDI